MDMHNKQPDPEDYDSFEDFLGDCLDEGEDMETCQTIWDNRAADGIKHKTHAGKTNGMEFVLSDETPDRMDDVIMSDGWVLDNFQKNPIALFGHNSAFPIGKWNNLRVEDKQLRGHLELAPKGTSPRIDEIRGLIEADILRAVSVGFKPLASRPREETDWGSFYTKQELVECSVVAVPANPNALALAAKAKGLHISSETMDLIRAGQGKAERIRNRGFHGGHARKSRNGRGQAMHTLSQHIAELEKRITEWRDQLDAHVAELDNSDVKDEDLVLMSNLTSDIAKAERTRATLLDTEKTLAKGVASQVGAGTGRAVSTVVLTEPVGTAQIQAPPQRVAAPALIINRKKDLDLLDLYVRSAAAFVMSKITNKPLDETRQRIYGDDEGTKAVFEIVTRAPSAPALTTVAGWAQELAQTTYADLMPILMPKAILTRLAPRGLTLSFGSAGRIVIPTRLATPTLAGSFVGEGLAIPVRQGAFTSQTLTPKKLAVISTWTREMGDHSIPSIEGLIREAIQQDTSVAIDTVLIDANAATAIRPAGLLNGVSVTTATAGAGINALVTDITNLINAISLATKGNVRNLVFLVNPTDMLRASWLTATNTGIFPFRDEIARGMLGGIPFIDSTTITARTVILVDAADFVVVGGDAPRMDISDQATLHMEDTSPADLVISPSTVAAPQRSLFQTDSLALRLVMPLNWVQRRTGTIAWTSSVTW